jgi:hypothetical protein
MPVLLPKRIIGAPASLVSPEAELEALIKEARERQQRRRLRTLVVGVVLVAAAAVAYGIVRGDSGTSQSPAAVGIEGAGPRVFSGQGLLAFVSRGDLFVLNGRKGTSTLVTARGEQPTTPQFSPNGRWLSFSLGTGQFVLARADGTEAHAVAAIGGAAWLPNSKLLVGRSIYRVTNHVRLARVAAAPPGLNAWADDGSRYAFVQRRLVYGKNGSFHGAEVLELASKLNGPRTLWHQERISFTRRKGFLGAAIDGVVVLPHRQGVLVSFDPMQSASLAADGTPMYEIRSSQGPLRKLGVTVGQKISVGKAGQLAIGAGPDRYAWSTKTVETCAPASSSCTSVSAPIGKLTLDPAWSPDGKTLAFVAAKSQSDSDFFQKTIRRWYSTRHLWLLRAGASRPVELPGTVGAAAPVWSRNGKSLLYVGDDALWLIARVGQRPVRVTGPLFPTGHWPSYYGQIDWTSQFAWLSP